MKHLFVYGTLKPGGPFYPAIEDFVLDERGATVMGYLYDTGLGFPSIAIDDKGMEVKGIALMVADEHWDALLQETDWIEGYPALYDRLETFAFLGQNDELSPAIPVTVYVGDKELNKHLISKGEWLI